MIQKKASLKILFVSAEVSPYAKTGGLADVAGSLPKTLAALGNDVRVVMPRYKKIIADMEYITDFPVSIGSRKETCIVRTSEMRFKDTNGSGSLPVYFLDNYHYYDRDGIYCYSDDAERFAFFCRSVLEMLPKISFKPDVIHCNDWHTGPICMLLKEQYREDSFYSGIATLYTIHNLEYQGNFPKEVLRFFNLGSEVFTPEKAEFYGMFSFMKAGLVYSDTINTVSKMYAEEIKTPQYGEGMEGILTSRSDDLLGIINGISYEEFNPAEDPRIFKNYSLESYRDKSINKAFLQEEMGLPREDVPLIGLVSRLSGQKGLNLLIEQADRIFSGRLQFVLLGEGDEYYHQEFRKIHDRYPEKVALHIGFNAVLAQKIYAGSDMFLMPSRFEPCGLGQIISLRYGTIPIVRSTGGLAETVTDFDDDRENGNGFAFKEFSSVKLAETVERALNAYNGGGETWDKLVKRALSADFSWTGPAQKYIEAYYRAIEKGTQ